MSQLTACDRCIGCSIVSAPIVIIVLAFINTAILTSQGWADAFLNATAGVSLPLNITGRVFLVGLGFAGAELTIACLIALGVYLCWRRMREEARIDAVLQELQDMPSHRHSSSKEEEDGGVGVTLDGTASSEKNHVASLEFDSDSDGYSL